MLEEIAGKVRIAETDFTQSWVWLMLQAF